MAKVASKGSPEAMEGKAASAKASDARFMEGGASAGHKRLLRGGDARFAESSGQGAVVGFVDGSSGGDAVFASGEM